jgi:hypothetical protein
MRRPRAVIWTSALAVVLAASLFVPGTTSAAPSSKGRFSGGIADRRSVAMQPRASAVPSGDVAGLTPRQLKLWALLNNPNVSSTGGPNYELECTSPGTPPNTLLDCDDPVAPKNEPDIEVDPADPNHMIASANDYESCCDAFYTTFDGGGTWYVGDMSTLEDGRIGSDPVTAFDTKHGVALHTSLNFICTDVACGEGDVVVSPSYDGGITWEQAIEVYDGEGFDFDPVQVFNDKEWIVADNNPSSPFYGRVYVTWSRFLSFSGAYAESPIWESHSDDGGLTWSTAQEISGSGSTCTFQEEGAALECDEDQFSVPTIGPGGVVYVAFENEQHEAAWEPGDSFENQYMVVKSTDGGVTWSPPVSVVDLEDGGLDYPVNVNGRQTLSGLQVRVNSAGNIVADPNSGKLYLVFGDNRNGVHDSTSPVTNIDVFVMTSHNGTTWQGPFPITKAPKDQWFPWVDVNPVTGDIGVVYNDRTGSRILYNAVLATGDPAGALSYQTVSTASSNPFLSAFFRASVSTCQHCATFHGDYINISYGSDGVAHLVWTDMRRFIPGKGYTENIFHAVA